MHTIVAGKIVAGKPCPQPESLSKTVRHNREHGLPGSPQASEDPRKRSYEIFDVLPDSLVTSLREAGFRVSYYGEKRIGCKSTVLRW